MPVGAPSLPGGAALGRRDLPRTQEGAERAGARDRRGRRRRVRAEPRRPTRTRCARWSRRSRRLGTRPARTSPSPSTRRRASSTATVRYHLDGEGRTLSSRRAGRLLGLDGRPVPDRVDRGRDGRGRLGRLGRPDRGAGRAHPARGRRPLRDQQRPAGAGHRAPRGQQRAGEGQPDRHPHRDARHRGAGHTQRLHERDVAPVRGDRGHHDRRPGGGHELRPDQDRRPWPAPTAWPSTTSSCGSRTTSTRARPSWAAPPWPSTAVGAADGAGCRDRSPKAKAKSTSKSKSKSTSTRRRRRPRELEPNGGARARHPVLFGVWVTLVVVVALALILFLVLPTRTWLGQRSGLSDASRRLEAPHRGERRAGGEGRVVGGRGRDRAPGPPAVRDDPAGRGRLLGAARRGPRPAARRRGRTTCSRASSRRGPPRRQGWRRRPRSPRRRRRRWCRPRRLTAAADPDPPGSRPRTCPRPRSARPAATSRPRTSGIGGPGRSADRSRDHGKPSPHVSTPTRPDVLNSIRWPSQRSSSGPSGPTSPCPSRPTTTAGPGRPTASAR